MLINFTFCKFMWNPFSKPVKKDWLIVNGIESWINLKVTSRISLILGKMVLQTFTSIFVLYIFEVWLKSDQMTLSQKMFINSLPGNSTVFSVLLCIYNSETSHSQIILIWLWLYKKILYWSLYNFYVPFM